MMLQRDQTYNDIWDRIERLEALIEDLRDVSRPTEVVLIEGEWQAIAGWVSDGTILRDVNNRIILDPSIPRIQIDDDGYIESADFVAGASGFQINGGTAEFNDVVVRGTIYATAGELGDLSVTGTLTLSGVGKLITAASPNPRIELTTTLLAGYSDAVTKEFWIDATDGKAYAGGGVVRLASDGVAITAAATWQDVRAYKILDSGGTKIGTYEGQVYSGMHELRAHVPERSGESSQFDILVECPAATYASKFIATCIRTGILTLTFSIENTASLARYRFSTGGYVLIDDDARIGGGLAVGSSTIDPPVGEVHATADVYPAADALGIAARRIWPYANFVSHFRTGDAAGAGELAAYSWQAAPFGGAPGYLNYSVLGEFLAFVDLAAPWDRHYLARSITNAAASWQNKHIVARMRTGQITFACLRIDANDDANFVELYLDGSAFAACWTVRFRGSDAGVPWGPTTTSIIMPAKEFIILYLYVYWDGANYWAYGYMVPEDILNVNITGFVHQLTGNWAAGPPTAGRVGLMSDNTTPGAAGNPVVFDVFYTDFT